MRLLIATAAAVLTASSAQALTFVNGSFEDGVALTGPFSTLATGDTTSIFGWKVLSDGVDYIGSYWQASDGARSLDLSALTSGGVSQMVGDFTAGQRYRITFDVSGNPDGGDNPKRILVSATGGDPETFSYALTAANSKANMLWQTYTYDFVASGPMQLVQFRSFEFNPYGATLDNVSISLVPEPATWALLVAGFGLTGLLARRRNRAKSSLA